MTREVKRAHVARRTGNTEWYTPPLILSLVRQSLGAIDLDPASSDKANELVCAGRYYTRKTDGLVRPWAGRVYLNPPYARGVIDQFVGLLIEGVQTGAITAAVSLTNNATETQWFKALARHCSAMCLIEGRVRFYTEALLPARRPLQGQVACYFGPNVGGFAEHFSQIGHVLRPVKQGPL